VFAAPVTAVIDGVNKAHVEFESIVPVPISVAYPSALVLIEKLTGPVPVDLEPNEILFKTTLPEVGGVSENSKYPLVATFKAPEGVALPILFVPDAPA
jgi:hypothetical protein